IRPRRVASLASLSAVAVGFVSLIVLHLIGWQTWRPVGWPVIILGVTLAGLVLIRHRTNIERLARGRELKITTHCCPSVPRRRHHSASSPSPPARSARGAAPPSLR